ncbi:MAG: c-type cytochrome [Myxococcales bacterium]
MSLLRSSSRGVVAVLALSAVPASAAGKAAPSPGQAVYDRDCAHCHGATGKGDGEESAYLNPSPQDFTTGILDKRSDDFLAAVIAEGGAAKGLSGAMPPSPKLSKDDVKTVVAYIRQLGKGAAGQKGK